MAAQALSEDSDRYPIEPAVLPLVYALTALRVIQPCWSCEGHISNALPCKLPEVWFYATAVAYVDLVGRHIADLGVADQLSAEWAVEVCPHQQTSIATVFRIRPLIRSDAEFHLGKLRADMDRIAESIGPRVRELAELDLRALPQDRH